LFEAFESLDFPSLAEAFPSFFPPEGEAFPLSLDFPLSEALPPSGFFRSVGEALVPWFPADVFPLPCFPLEEGFELADFLSVGDAFPSFFLPVGEVVSPYFPSEGEVFPLVDFESCAFLFVEEAFPSFFPLVGDVFLGFPLWEVFPSLVFAVSEGCEPSDLPSVEALGRYFQR
jgi:hypothetical protein